MLTPHVDSRKDSPIPASTPGAISGAKQIARPNISRTPSTATVTQSRVRASPSSHPSQRTSSGASGSQRRPDASDMRDEDLLDNHGDEDDASESEEEPSSLSRSQIFRRAPLTKKAAVSVLSSHSEAGDDEEESSSGGYLPFAAVSKPSKADPAATLRGAPRKQPSTSQRPSSRSEKPMQEVHSSSASSASSAQPPPSSSSETKSKEPGRPEQRNAALSPKQRAALTSLSPRHRKNGSEGTPSMGSSFSDLDDASVTQSALEDALLSNMQHGGFQSNIGSRISGIGSALRNKKAT